MSAVETRTDLVQQLQSFLTNKHFTRSDALPLPSRHSSKHCVAYNCVFTVIQPQLLHHQVRREFVVCRHYFHSKLFLLWYAVLKRFDHPRLQFFTSAALVSELEGFLHC
ncbi:hypothetical protein P3T76_015295 [Phytophthora citrophthora]|uniref:Uncharacterized protein n=1 Tax=Phytophthora citrophthora TaxID=4793 RepID=A0AAD9LB53_9STRA|nr:hypothetical protein P3T76_015295 [Phytophthora citrophthora]